MLGGGLRSPSAFLIETAMRECFACNIQCLPNKIGILIKVRLNEMHIGLCRFFYGACDENTVVGWACTPCTADRSIRCDKPMKGQTSRRAWGRTQQITNEIRNWKSIEMPLIGRTLAQHQR